MKIKNNIIIGIIFFLILIPSCNSNGKNKAKEAIQETKDTILDKKELFIEVFNDLPNKDNMKDRYDVQYDGIYNENPDFTIIKEDVEDGMDLLVREFLAKGYKQPSEEIFYKAIEEKCNINRSELSSNNICVNDYGTFFEKITKDPIWGYFDFPNTTPNSYTLDPYKDPSDWYFSKKCKIVMPLAPLTAKLLIFDTEKGQFKSEPKLIDTYFHLNTYFFYNSQTSLTWLVAEEFPTSLEGLVKLFGYDKDSRLNECVLQYIVRQYKLNENLDLLTGLFADKDIINNILNIRKEIIETVATNTNENNNDFLTLIETYGYQIAINNPGKIKESENLTRNFTDNERRKIIAYIANHTHHLYEKYANKGMAKYNQGSLLRNLAITDNQLIEEIEVNDYYGLSNLKEIVREVKNSISEDTALRNNK